MQVHPSEAHLMHHQSSLPFPMCCCRRQRRRWTMVPFCRYPCWPSVQPRRQHNNMTAASPLARKGISSEWCDSLPKNWAFKSDQFVRPTCACTRQWAGPPGLRTCQERNWALLIAVVALYRGLRLSAHPALDFKVIKDSSHLQTYLSKHKEY